MASTWKGRGLSLHLEFKKHQRPDDASSTRLQSSYKDHDFIVARRGDKFTFDEDTDHVQIRACHFI